MAEPTIYDIAKKHRKALLAGEREAASQMVRYYGEAWQKIKVDLDALLAQIADARKRGEEVSQAWLFQAQRLEYLQARVEEEMARFARYAGDTITAQERQVVGLAQEHANELVRAQVPPTIGVTFMQLPTEALGDLVGFLADGSPLSDLLDELGPEASKEVRRALVTGVATGQNPRVIAKWVRGAMGGNLTRALRISRTEVLRCYRESSHRAYEHNKDVISGWIWYSALDQRTCAACIAMHGTEHPVSERLEDHVNGRCVMVPMTKPWRELGFRGVPETRVSVESGEDWFERQPAETRERILGPAKYQLWREGQITLRDIVGRKTSRKWGGMVYEKSVREILAG